MRTSCGSRPCSAHPGALVRIVELAPDQRGRVSALLDNGNAIRLTGVTRDNLHRVLAAAGKRSADPD